jgi:predicted alpha/beta hydrolase
MEVTLQAADGYRLGATLYRPDAANGCALQISSAAGVRQEYYAKFAAYFAARGFTVLTFDYRGIGRSLQGHVRQARARMQDWALLDAAAAFAFLGDRKVHVVGHSFGGQALGLLPQPQRIAAALLVGSQSGYWKNWPLAGRAWMWPATHVALPSLARLHGYFPGSRFGFGEDLPAGVALQWASWCRHPRYLVGALGVEDVYSKVKLPVRAYAIADDPFAPLPAVEALRQLYPNARWETRRLAPREVGARTLGHFGFFRERFRDSLWREAADWLEAQ